MKSFIVSSAIQSLALFSDSNVTPVIGMVMPKTKPKTQTKQAQYWKSWPKGHGASAIFWSLKLYPQKHSGIMGTIRKDSLAISKKKCMETELDLHGMLGSVITNSPLRLTVLSSEENNRTWTQSFPKAWVKVKVPSTLPPGCWLITREVTLAIITWALPLPCIP